MHTTQGKKPSLACLVVGCARAELKHDLKSIPSCNHNHLVHFTVEVKLHPMNMIMHTCPITSSHQRVQIMPRANKSRRCTP